MLHTRKMLHLRSTALVSLGRCPSCERAIHRNCVSGIARMRTGKGLTNDESAQPFIALRVRPRMQPYSPT